MNWKQLDSISQLDAIELESQTKPVIIFKHSTSCSISSMAKARLERQWDLPEESISAWHLDLIAHRDISNAIATKFHVHHESPQILYIVKGECVYDESHMGISVKGIKEQLNS
ncbi:MAG: bacillithiol system redox-active protein YtxJ [Bacteroidia bacterium]|nr:bacillithiol system redox-active protein YtxJ [Bacteroidia bacterium]